MRSLRKILFLVSSFILINIFMIFSEEYINNKIGYSIDFPEGWKIIDSSDPYLISFSNQDNSVIFKIVSFKGDNFNNSEEIFNYIKDKLKATGDKESFFFSGKDSIFADLNFNLNIYNVRGYFIFINSTAYDFALLAYSDLANYDKNHDYLLSVLDSFSPDKEAKLLPGPVSQFYYPGDSRNKKPVKLVIEGKVINTFLDYDEIEATQILVEREARILANYNPGKEDIIKPWIRYYNLIYRDNYNRIKDLNSLVLKSINLDKKDKNETVRRLLLWIQNYNYSRSGTISDLTSPLDSFYSFTGDCDSRALLLLIILHQIGIDAVLLVSTKYKHSAIGINIEGDGARIEFNGRSYLYAELTEVIEIGLVPTKMADYSAWIPMNIGY